MRSYLIPRSTDKSYKSLADTLVEDTGKRRALPKIGRITARIDHRHDESPDRCPEE